MLRRRAGSWVTWVTLVGLVLLLAGGYYYLYSGAGRTSVQAKEEAPVQTATVRRGNLVISASGTGTVVPSAELNLAFDTSGVLTEVVVKPGDKVAAGDTLARIDDLAARQAVASAQAQVLRSRLDLSAAQDALDELQAGGSETEILAARAAVEAAQEKLTAVQAGPTEADLAEAQAALATAQDAYQRLVDGPTQAELQEAQLHLSQAKNSLWSTQSNRDAVCGQSDTSTQCHSAQASVLNGEISVQLADMTLQQLQEPATQAETQSALAEVTRAKQQLADLQASPTAAETTAAQAELAQAQDVLDELTSGPTPDDVVLAQAEVDQAQLDLDQAELNLESAQREAAATVLTAPADGTIMSVDAEAGERVSNTPIITLADLSRPYLEVFLDETDLDKIGVGYEADVVFDALPDDTYTGEVVQVDPSLYTSGGVSAIRALVRLNEDSFAKPQGLPAGLNAAVDVIGGRAENAVLVPVEALRELAPDEYAVFVMENGEPRLRQVQVGLMDFTQAEIVSGLEPGEVVTTGIVETE